MPKQDTTLTGKIDEIFKDNCIIALGHYDTDYTDQARQSILSLLEREIGKVKADYAHPTRPGWCCACDADIAFAMDYIKDEPEFKSLLDSEVRKARIDELDILYHTGGDCETVWYALCDRLSELKENK